MLISAFAKVFRGYYHDFELSAIDLLERPLSASNVNLLGKRFSANVLELLWGLGGA